MKYLSPSKTSSTRIFQRGIADLAMEACFLSLLSHEYIIGLHYVSEGTLEENYGCCDVGQQQRRHQQQHVTREEIVMDANGNLCVKRHYVEQTQQPRIPRVSLFVVLYNGVTQRSCSESSSSLCAGGGQGFEIRPCRVSHASPPGVGIAELRGGGGDTRL